MKKRILLIPFFLCFFSLSVYSDPVEIKVDATRVIGKLEPFWASQIVHPTEFLLTEWGMDLVRLMGESGAANRFIRVYNQPETAIRIAADGKITYNWSRFDRMADLILSTGNKVQVVFFGMPAELAVYPQSARKRPYGALVCTSPPKDYKQWEELCADFTRHIVQKYGLKEVKNWTLRCWNEPDGNFWYKGDLKEYLKLYDYFAKAVKEVHPDIIIGGPALTSTGTWRKPENLRFFLEHVATGVNHATGGKGSPIDYISIHTYGGSSGGPGPGRESPEVDYMIEQQLKAAAIRDEYPALRNLPIHVEEWGETSGGTTGINDKPATHIRNSQYGAAFLVAWVERHIRMKQENDPKIENFTFCASGYEKIPEHDFMGYRTLHTKNGFHKPILNAYKLLKNAAPGLLGVETLPAGGNVTAFASRDEKRITVVVVNYQDDKIDNDGSDFQVKLGITTKWKPSSGITLKHWRIDETHSNAYTVFKNLGSPALPNPIEMDAIKSKMDLELLDKPARMKAEQLKNMEFSMPCNSVSLLEIIRE